MAPKVEMGPTEKYLAGFFIRGGQNQSNKGVVVLLSEKKFALQRNVELNFRWLFAESFLDLESA